MAIDAPTSAQIPQLLRLWNGIFGEYGGFWKLFLETGFSPERCRCITEEGSITASLCWFDVECAGRKMAYLYAVLTDPDHRGKGLCRRLMEDTHEHLTRQGYSASLLVPAEESLRGMYRKMGYEDSTAVTEFSCTAGTEPVSLRAIGPTEFAQLRRGFLLSGGVIQEEANLSFLAGQAQFFTGGDFLMAAYTEEGTLHAMELLGNREAAPGILAALECRQGSFRIPGDEKPFAMFHRLTADAGKPAYFGFAFD